jgi:hypothetical protein
LFPSTVAGAVEEAVLVNTAGGIAGGDRLECDVTALSNACIAVTSQAAEKVYRALNAPARIATRLKVCEASKLAWLPQKTILFNLGRLSRTTDIEISEGAELLALEWLVLGRAAHGEEITGGHIADSWRVKKDLPADLGRQFSRHGPDLSAPAQKGSPFGLQVVWNARLLWTSSRRAIGILARHPSFVGLLLLDDLSEWADHRAFCSENVL